MHCGDIYMSMLLSVVQLLYSRNLPDFEIARDKLSELNHELKKLYGRMHPRCAIEARPSRSKSPGSRGDMT